MAIGHDSLGQKFSLSNQENFFSYCNLSHWTTKLCILFSTQNHPSEPPAQSPRTPVVFLSRSSSLSRQSKATDGARSEITWNVVLTLLCRFPSPLKHWIITKSLLSNLNVAEEGKWSFKWKKSLTLCKIFSQIFKKNSENWNPSWI